MAFIPGALLLLLLAVATMAWAREGPTGQFNRSGFPPSFIFGMSTSAYQTEGAATEGGRGPSIWDTFTHDHPEKIADGSNGDIAIDSYHRYKEDISILKNLGADAYRFSIAWPRILPKGSLRGGVNKEGIQHYNDVINELVSKGLRPFVTLFHWDLPQELQDQYQGFLSTRVADDFRDFADICFKDFGDRVKYWITLNEPLAFVQMGYATGTYPSGRCSSFDGCTVGDSSREPYLATHHLLLAHAAAVNLYRAKYQASQKGKIGLTLITPWFMPYSNSKPDVEAATRALDFFLGWYLDPLTQEDYPFNMRALVGERLPDFTTEKSKMVKGSFDFIGLNYYTSYYAQSISLLTKVNVSFNTDPHAYMTAIRNGIPVGRQAGSSWLYVYPQGIRDVLLYIKNRYNNPVVYITENGVDVLYTASITLEEILKDDTRVDYYRGHLSSVQKAIREGANVRGYFTWSLLDDFEWSSGYSVGFGLYYVDHKNGLKRYPKKSAFWFREFLKR